MNNFKLAIVQNKVKVISSIIVILTIIAIVMIAIYHANETQRRRNLIETNPELARAMTYEVIEDKDTEAVVDGTSNVKFDAFFLRDINGDGYAESIRGTSKEIGAEDTLYMELNVVSEGYLENATITINGENFYLQTTLPKDNELADNYIGNNIKEIKLNKVNNGTQKLLTGIVRSGDYSQSSKKADAIGNNINNYSKVNSVTLTGTYVNGQGEKIEVSKTVEFNIDWYGKTTARINTTNQTKNIEETINEEEGTISLNFTIYTEETQKELVLSKNYVEGEIPELNGYTPIEVVYTGSNGVFNYDAENRTFTIDRTVGTNEEGQVTNVMSTSNSYGIRVVYPIEAYQSLGQEAVTIKIPVKTYYEGYNNPSEEFTNPYKSNIAQATVVVTYEKHTGDVSSFDIAVGKLVYTPTRRYIISKQKPLKIYNGQSEEEIDDTYLVMWKGNVEANEDGVELGGMVMKETRNDAEETTGENNQTAGIEQVTDKFIKTDGTEESADEIVSNVGIYFTGADTLLGEEGWIKVYDEDTGNLLVTFTQNDWNKYTSSNPYKYEIPVKHIRVETSTIQKNNTSFYVYNIKEIDDEKITTKYTKEQFDELQYIKSTLVGYVSGTYIETDTNQANYEAPISIANIGISNNTISTQSTEKNEKITIEAYADETANQVKWQNGTFLVKLPKEIIDAQINNVTINNPSVLLESYELIEQDGTLFIKIATKNDTPQTFDITVDVDLSPDPRIATTTKPIELYASNENGSDYYYKAQDIYDVNNNLNIEEQVNHTTTNISMVSPNSLLTNQTATNYDDKGSEIVSPEIADIKPIYAVVDQENEEQTAKIGVQLKNNYSSTISEIQILGKIPFEGNTYVLSGGDLGSTFTTKMTNTGIELPEELQGIVKIYYSDNENPDRDLSKVENNWKTAEEVENWDNIKTFLIDLGDYVMESGKEFVFNYTVKIPNGLEFNQAAYSHHGVYFCLDTDQGKYRTETEPNKLGFRIAEKYDLELTKYQTGKDKLVPGATYSITEIIKGEEDSEENNNEENATETRGESKTAVTTSQGKLTITNLYVEKEYEIREIKSPDDYELNTNVIRFIGHVDEEGNLSIEKTEGTTKGEITVTKEEGQNYKVNIQVEDEVKASIKIIKKEQGTDTTIQGARFKLTGYNLSENGRNLTTNANGEITFNGLSVNQEYTLQEVKLDGYYLANPITFKIVNNDGNYTVEKIEDETEDPINQTTTEEDGIPTINITLENEKIPTYSMQLIKVKKTTESTVSDDELIAQAETALADTEVEYLLGAKFKLYKGTEEIGEYITDETGTVTIDNLYQYETEKDVDQTYTLKEVLAPEGYAKVKDITFKVEEVEGILVLTTMNEEGQEQEGKNYVAEGNTIRLTIEDSPSFKLIKKDAETQTTLPNVKFAIYNVDTGAEQPATNSKGEIIGTKEIINGKEYYTITTDENGEITADLTEGLYKAVEVQAPDQYDISNSTYYFGIGASREAETIMSATQAMAIGGNTNDNILSVAPTSDGGYIAGGNFQNTVQIGEETFASKGGSDGIVIKYNAEGEVEWAKAISGASSEGIKSVAETSDGGYIAGGNFQSLTVQIGEYTLRRIGGMDGIIIKFDSKGEVEWAKTIGGGDTDDIQSVAETNDGGCIVGGNFSGNSIQVGDYTLTNSNGYTSDGMIIKYNSTGEVEWAKSIGGSGIDTIQSVAETSDGGMIVGGYYGSGGIQVGDYTLSNNDYEDGLIIKYDAEGEVEWAKGICGNQHEYIYSVTEASDGGFIAGGAFSSISIQVGDTILTSNGVTDGMIIKYSREGEVEWAKNIGGGSQDYIKSVVETSDGGIVVGGYFGSQSMQVEDYTLTNVTNGNGVYDAMLVKYASTGEVELAKTIGGSSNDYINSVTETLDGEIIAGGCFYSYSIQTGDYTLTNIAGLNYSDGMIIKFEQKELNNPITLQAQAIGGSGEDRVQSVASTSDGGYVVGGYFSSSEIKIGENVLENKGSNDGFVTKYSQTGEIEWIKQIGGSGNELIKSVEEASNGEIIVGGSFSSYTIQLDDYTLTNHSWVEEGLVIKYNSNGELEWAKAIGGSTNHRDEINSVAPTNDGGIIAGGSFDSKEIQLGDYTLTNNGGQDGMIIKYSSEGEVEWAKSIGESSTDYISSVASTKDGGYIAGGTFNASEIQIGDYTLTSNGYIDGMVIKYNHSGEVEWAKGIGSGKQDYINSVAETNDGDIIATGGFQSTFTIGDYRLTNSANGYRDIMIIKFTKDGEVKWATSMGKQYDDYIQSVTPTNDGGFIAGGYVYYSNQIQSGDYALTNTTTKDGIIIKYSAENKVEWMKGIGGNSSDYIQSLTETTDGTIIVGGYFESDTIETDGKTITNAGGQDGMLLKITNQVGVPEIQELTIENNRKEFEITTSVKEVNGVKGGNISGEDKKTYETVKYGDTSINEIKMTPDENYEIISITVNGEEYPFEANEDGTYTMPPFENMTEDKHVEVTYALKNNKFTINKMDAKTQSPLQGATFKIESTEEIEGEIYEQEVTTNSQGQATLQLPFGTYQITEIQAPDGYELLKDPIEVQFTEGSDNQEITIENNTIAKVIVHHYLKTEEGYTTTKVAEDDVIEKTDVETYTTSPKLDLEKYELEKDENGSYVVPDDATGNFISGETIEVTYYYEEKEIPLTVHHYIEGTTTPVPLKDGTEAQDEQKSGKEGTTYQTSEIEDSLLSDAYEIAEIPENAQGIYTGKEIVVTYYYKVKDSAGVIVHHIDTDSKEQIAPDVIIPLDGTGKYGDSYTTEVSQEIPANYEYVTRTDNWEGTMVDTLTEVTYEYRLVEPTITNQKISKTATESIENPKAEIEYGITYTTSIENYIGKAQVTIVDTLPYRIDVAKSSLNGGTYDEESQTITWTELVDGIDTYTNPRSAYIVINRNIKVVYLNMDVSQETIENNVSGKVKLVTPEKTSEEVTNTATTYTQFKMDITVNKVWEDNDIQSARRPEVVTINVIGEDDRVVQSYDLKVKEGETSHTFTDLPKYNHEGNEINYRIEEQEKTLGDLHFYTSSVGSIGNVEDTQTRGEGIINDRKQVTITNSFTRPDDEMSIIVNKIWNDNDIQAQRRPESLILVVKNGDQEVKTVEITKDDMVDGTTNQWSIVIDGLPKYNDNGEEIQYTVEEREKTEGDLKFYEAEENPVTVEDHQATIRNHFVRPDDTTTVTVSKVWNDNNNENGKRPESIIVKVTGNEQTYTQEINAIENEIEGNSNGCTYTFTDLPKYDDNGQEIVYTAFEEEVYTDDLKFYANDGITGDMTSGYTITNTFTVPDERIELTVNKVWEDNSTQAQRRPETIVINVKAENADNNDPEAVIDTYELNTATETSHTFTGLPKYNSRGDEIQYTVEEQEKNPGDLHFYTTVVGNVETTSENNKEVTITNTFEKPDDTTEVTVTKIWDDNNDEAAKRPGSIMLQLKNGNVVEDEQEVNESNKIEDQRKEQIIAEINERNNAINNGNAENPETDNQLDVNTVEVWQYTFTDVEKYNENGQEIVYRVDETEMNSNDLQFYNKEVNGLTVINTFTQDTTKVEVPMTKIWEDNEIQAQRRPESVVVILKANGIENQRYELSEETADAVSGNTWQYTFTDLPKYDEYNNIINYTVEEEEKVTGDLYFYTTKIDGTTITNTFTKPTDTIRIEVNKEWVDQDNAYEKRPNSIRLEVKSVENGTGKETVEQYVNVTKDDNWSATFTNLPKYDEDGQEIAYTVDEKEVMENDLFNYEKEIGEVTNKVDEVDVKEATITNTMTKIPGEVVVKYVDINTGEEISDSKTKEGIVGDTFDVTEDKKDIEGYTLVEEPDEKTGTYTVQRQTKIYYYAKDTSVIVKYLELDDTPEETADNPVLAKEVTIEGYEGKDYTTVEEEIPGYTLVATTDNLEGTMQRDEIVVIYYYAPNTNVIVKYLEQDNTPNDNSDNKVLAGEVNIEGYVGKAYTTTEETIPGYTLVATTDNLEGTMTKDPIEVIYYYAQNTKVIVKYLEQDDTPDDNTDNQVLAKEITIEGHAGQEYTTQAQDIEGYTLVARTDNWEGTMTNDVIEVIYYYAQNTKATVQHIDRETGDILKEETQEGKVGDLFETHAEDFEGYVLVESPEEPNIIMDKTGEQIVKYYYAHVSAGVIEKHIDDITGELLYSEEHQGNEGDAYNIPARDFEGYDLVTEDEDGNSRLPDNAQGEMKRDEVIEVKYYYIKKAKVIVKYLEEDDTPEDTTDNQVLAKEEIIEGHENDSYETKAKDIEDYNLVKTPENATGTMVITKNPDGTYNTEIEVIYYYKKAAGGVIENHIDITTGNILATEERQGNVGDAYDIPSRTFEGYDLVEVDSEGNNMLPENATGTMTEEEIVVNYYYIKQAKVKVEYIDKITGEKLDEEEIQGHVGDSYETEEKEFDAYELVEKPSNSTGEMTEEETVVKYYYQRKAEVEVKYLEKGTEYEIAPSEIIEGLVGDNYETSEKDIPYYKFVEKTNNWEGTMTEEKITVIYYYEKQIFNLSVDKWVSSVNVNGIHHEARSINNKDEMYVVDIHRSKTETADIRITYTIRVTNTGEIEGTAGQIMEIIPKGYSYYQEDNNIYWEERNGTFVTDTLKDETIEPGEYKEIEIVLRWNKGEENFGEKENLVILTEANNPAGYQDVNEGDNHSTSDMMITVATGLDTNGRIILTASITMALSIILAVNIGLFIACKKKEK